MWTATEKFMATQIIKGGEGREYLTVITARPDLKDGIDAYLRSVGREDLIVSQEQPVTEEPPTEQEG